MGRFKQRGTATVRGVRSPRRSLFVATVALGFLASCTGGGSSTAGGESASPGAERTSATAAEGRSGAGPCPAHLVIQTDWFPEAEHGGTYQLIGAGGTADKETLRYRGPLQPRYRGAHGVQTVEIRAGGAAVGGKPVTDLLFSDDSIYFGYVNTDDAVAAWAKNQRTVGVSTTLELSPQMLMWNPARYSITKFSDLARSHAQVLTFPGLLYPDFLVAKGILNAEQVDPSYTGDPARWLGSGGAIIQQGFATNEVYLYERDLPAWRRQVDFFLVHWFGYENYPAMLSIRADRIDHESACLQALVPVMQQAWVDFFADPKPMNDGIVRILETYDTFFKVSPGLNAEAMRILDTYAIASNGPDDVYGNFDLDRVDRLVKVVQGVYEARGAPAPRVGGRDVVSNAFIDSTIGRKPT